MSTKKPTKKSAGKAPAKTTSKGKALDLQAVKAGRMVLYGPPIRDAIRRGDAAEMKKLAVLARSHLKDVQSALKELEKSIDK